MQLISIISFFIVFFAKGDWRPNTLPKSKHKFVVICHRGNHVIYPENSIEADSAAIAAGADYIEIDLRTTSDGKLISMHDATVNRMTTGKGLVKDLTLGQIEQLRIINPKNKQDSAVYRVPTFEQILRLTRNKIHIYIDFKEADATQTLTMLKQFGMEKQVLVYINKPSQFVDWRKTYPKMPLMVSLPDSAKGAERMRKFINRYHPDILDGNFNEYNAEMIALANAIDLPVWPDIQGPQEGPALWDKAIAMGFKGLQTDNPPALVAYLKEKGLR
jgi:glycerophosphoryl diester phosphodiesterase